MTEKINEFKKSDLEKLEEIHKILSNKNKKTEVIIEELKKEIENENLRNK